MKVLDLFSGLGGFSQAFKDQGHEVVTVDIEEKFKPTICSDIMELGPEDFPGHWDIVLASPPCNCFSVAALYRHWDGSKPKYKGTLKAIALIHYTIALIDSIGPRYWILENPRGKLRHVIGLPKVTTYWAAWGMPYLKPTDLWGTLPPMDWPKPTKWEPGPKGAKTGLQGVGFKKGEILGNNADKAVARSLVPYEFSSAICKAVEGAIPKESLLNYLGVNSRV